ncbi:hypothetical protein JG688_00003796 [Phytophthora aleatoria]|uniref:EF-hand domain-containing protein n=1 Tax=Phytophthora aleatoria TaxID=2496075 RepID=A0A8J5MI94_9STRA|nr:hypothetical protein JG688_00003796 [Phytophthora aleatoria]
MSRQQPPISTRDVQEYIQRQSRLCDSRIEDAYMRLSGSYGDSKQSAPVSRPLSSSMNLPSRKHLKVDTVTRPSSAQERRSTGCINIEKPRGILKKTQSPVGNSRLGWKSESPDEWFQRIMSVKKLSPLDLCELFSYGDARKNPLVSLSHVCEVLFDLDPETVTGADPVTEEMEEFLCQFATEECGEIMVNIREALRALDIWQSRVTSAQVVSSTLASNPQSKTAILESKNRKLNDVISSLQDANLRLSRQLDSAKLAISPKSTEESAPPAWSPKGRATMKSSSAEVSPKFKPKSTTKSRKFSSQSDNASSSGLQVVNLHEQELVEIASKLEFTGVKRLEQLLIEEDADSTGFVTLKQLCWRLVEDFDLKISETRLIEVCMGMNFNANGQLDYTEFVDVLLDILIYALPDIRESAKRKSIMRLDQYLQSGFPPGRADVRQLLDALCSNCDVKGDQIISVADLVRVFHVDLVKHHALELPFPLEEHETIQLAHPFIQHKTQDATSGGFPAYPELLDAILGPFPTYESNDVEQLRRALTWEFWRKICVTLCGGDAFIKQKVLAQLGNIMAKLDPDQTFTISTKHFKRIFERHIDSEDMDILVEVLAMAEDAKSPSNDTQSGPYLRYDVLLKLAFGSPDLNDETFFEKCVRKKLFREKERLQSLFKEITTQGSSHKLTLQDFHDTFIVQAEEHPLTRVEMLYLFASVDSSHEGTVEVKAVKNFLSRKCWRNAKYHGNDTTSTAEVVETGDIESVKKLIAKCCKGYHLQRVFDGLGRKTQGWISHSVIVKELGKMLHEMGTVGVDHIDLNNLVQTISQSTIGDIPKTSSRDTIHCDAFFDALFDWNAVVTSMRLPDSLVEVKRVFEKFDWDQNGTIRSEDWNKAYRLICSGNHEMAEWEVRVLQRKFTGQRAREETIDYARLIVFLLDFQQRQARKTLQLRVVKYFQQQFASTMSTAKIERLFHALDTDSKGYFNAADLKTYLTKEFARESEKDEDSSSVLLNSADAVASVMRLLAGDRSRSKNDSSGSQTVVTFERFREISSSFSAGKHKSPTHSHSDGYTDQRISQIHPSRPHSGTSNELEGDNEIISSLRVLEIRILDIAHEFPDLKGNMLPARAFRYFSFGPTAADISRQTPPSSPFRRSSLSISTIRSSGSLSNRKKQRDLEASNLDPLTPSRLKQMLQIHHNVEVSRHLISRFFLHIGSPSKYFLDLLHFAQWVVPISIELQVKVRSVVRQMLVMGKGGGGRVDLDRFLAQLQRRLHDSPIYRSHENSQPSFVSMPLLLSKLHQLNIPLHKQELLTLLRHFGMEEDLEAVDYALFLQRLYELYASMTS